MLIFKVNRLDAIVGDDTGAFVHANASIILDCQWLSKDYRLGGGGETNWEDAYSVFARGLYALIYGALRHRENRSWRRPRARTNLHVAEKETPIRKTCPDPPGTPSVEGRTRNIFSSLPRISEFLATRVKRGLVTSNSVHHRIFRTIVSSRVHIATQRYQQKQKKRTFTVCRLFVWRNRDQRKLHRFFFFRSFEIGAAICRDERVDRLYLFIYLFFSFAIQRKEGGPAAIDSSRRSKDLWSCQRIDERIQVQSHVSCVHGDHSW